MVLGMLVLLYLVVETYYDLQAAKESANMVALFIQMTIWAFLFGILMEWRGLRSLINGRFTFNWKIFIPTAILSAFVFIPNIYWVSWYGVSQATYPNIFLLPETHMILSVLAGTMAVRSLAESKQ